MIAVSPLRAHCQASIVAAAPFFTLAAQRLAGVPPTCRTAAEQVPNIYRTVTEQLARSRVSERLSDKRALSAVAIWQPQVARQHPFWGGGHPFSRRAAPSVLLMTLLLSVLPRDPELGFIRYA